MVARPLFEGPSTSSYMRYRRWLGLRAGSSYAACCVRRAALGVEYTKGCEFEQTLHGGETSAEDSSVRFDRGPDAEVDKIICGEEFSTIAWGNSGTGRTSKVGRILANDNAIQAESSRDNDTGARWSEDRSVMGFTNDSHSAQSEDEYKSSLL